MGLLSERYPFWFTALTLLCSLIILVFASSQLQQDVGGNRVLVARTAPAYPALARSMALQGVVKIEAVVSPEGSVETVDIKGGHPVLAQPAANAVRQWRWERASYETRELVEVKFSRD
ncbi:MAG: energy transducer TonB [Terriglobales bacterium]